MQKQFKEEHSVRFISEWTPCCLVGPDYISILITRWPCTKGHFDWIDAQDDANGI